MSTFFARFDDIQASRNALEQLISNGVRPDDVSMVSRQSFAGRELLETASVGDASFFVGRADDPEQGLFEEAPFEDITTTREFNGTMGIDTSDSGRNVESVDQADDSQSAAEDLSEPDDTISQGEHEVDDLAMAVQTGFPTSIRVIDSIEDTKGPVQEQLLDTLETLAIPGGGTVVGGGALATAAFDLNSNPDNLRAFLLDEGLDRESVAHYMRILDDGGALVAISVAPGSVQEPMVEQVIEACGGQEGGLFDAPRFGTSGYVA